MTSANAKKKRVSKKSKSSWRKFVNTKDVDAFLEDKRLEERLGKPLEERTDGELFQIDTQPVKVELSTKQIRRQKLLLPPKCFQMLQSHSKVPDPITKRNRVRTPEERQNKLIKLKNEERRRQGIMKAKDRLAIRDRKTAIQKKIEAKYKKNFKKDLWVVEERSADDNIIQNEWVDNCTKVHTLKNSGKMLKQIPTSVWKKPSVVPSVEPPHPGLSYNPSFEDHQALLNIVAERELKVIKEEKRLDRVTSKMFSKVTVNERENAWMKEMSQGLEKNKSETSDSENEYSSVNPPVQNKKKDRKKRRKQKEEKQQQFLLKHKKQEKKKVSDIHKLKVLQEGVKKHEQKTEELRKKREIKKALKVNEPKRLSSKKFEDPEVEFSLGDELSGNLRNLKSKNSLLLDRFKSLQKRNILEPSTLQFKKKGKVKKYEKATNKMGWESKGY